MPRKILLIIDPQIDFHDTEGEVGSLAVPGSHADSERIAAMIRNNINEISDIYVTMDSHHRNHIAHAAFWTKRGKEGNRDTKPENFSIITHDEIVKGDFQPVDLSLLEHCKEYTKSLEDKGRFKLTIWPEHCLIGTVGHAVADNINGALQDWSVHNLKTINYVLKGQNCLTEMYSCIEAEVPVPTDSNTQKNEKLLNALRQATELYVCGQAKSHCVNYTVRDIVKYWKKDCPEKLREIHLLRDGMSSVKGYEESGEKFLEEMQAEGVQVITCDKAFK